MSLGIGLMIGGGLVAVLGVLLLLNHNGVAKMVVGLILAVVGLGVLGVGYTMDQKTEVTYTVVEITAVSARQENNNYRVRLKAEGGTDTWIYVNDSQIDMFPKDGQVTMTKSMLKTYRNQTE